MKSFKQILIEAKRGKKQIKDHTDHVGHYDGAFWVGRSDIETGKEISRPGQNIKFKHKGKTHHGTVTDEATGRDDSAYRVAVYKVDKKD